MGWIVIGIIASCIHKNQLENPKVWKVIVVILIGLLTFSIKLDVFDRVLQFSILPLGVWLLYWFFRKDKLTWQKYRSFAWLGFISNYILLVLLLVGIWINHLLYPGNILSTYISNVENAYIFSTHPTANESALDKRNLIASIHTAKQKDYFSDSWYNEVYLEEDPETKKERFPYMLVNALPKWGSGLHTTIYLEKNGKGILITTQEKQLYFKTKYSLLEEAE